MQTGFQLRALFAVILLLCVPAQPGHLWNQFKVNICDDVKHQLQRQFQIAEPSEDQIYDYGLYLLEKILHRSGRHLNEFAGMPNVQGDWERREGNYLIAEQLSYDSA